MGRLLRKLSYLITWPYALVLWLRHLLFDRGLRKSYSFDTHSISVGNVTVGGTGKTPMVAFLLDHFLRSRPGQTVAVLSRGYKRKGNNFRYVTTADRPALVGDEPLQLKRNFPQALVAVDTDRVAGMMRLRRDHPALGLVLLDDAFQHRRLRPTHQVVLARYQRPPRQDALLPFGRLRDLPGRCARAQAVVVTKCPPPGEADSQGLRLDRRFRFPVPTFFTYLDYGELCPVFPPEPDQGPWREALEAPQVIALSGIAAPEPFVEYLQRSYQVLKHFRFADHHAFTPLDMMKVRSLLLDCDKLALITTEKDAMRLRPHQLFFEEEDRNGRPLWTRVFYVSIKVAFYHPQDEAKLLELLGL